MVILLAGASGLLGSVLHAQPTQPTRLLLRRDSPPTDHDDVVLWDARTPPSPQVFEDVTGVVNLAGVGIGDRRWSARRLDLIRRSRVETTQALALGLSQLDRPIRFRQASAVGFYGDTGDYAATEMTPDGNTTVSTICSDWEAAATPAQSAGHPSAFLRAGFVLHPNGGALAPLMRIIRLGLGGPLGNGSQWWSWIHIDDWIRAVLFLLKSDIQGPVNITSPKPVKNREFTTELAQSLNRPALFPAPKQALRLVLGGFAEELLRDQRVIPKRLHEAGFTFHYEDLKSALQAVTP